MRRLLPITLVLTALLLAGCGTSGGQEAAPPSDVETSGTDQATTPADDDRASDPEEPTTEPTDVADAITPTQLEAILPTAADIGPDYEVTDTTGADDEPSDEPDEAPDAGDAAVEEACPMAKEIGLMEEDGGDQEVSVEFGTDDDRSIEVGLDADPRVYDEETFGQVIDAYNDCGEISFEDEDLGTVTMDLTAQPLEGHGDVGAELTVDMDFRLFQVPVTFQLHGYVFMVDGVGVSIMSSSGLDQDTFETVPADEDLLPALAEEMQSRIEAL